MRTPVRARRAGRLRALALGMTILSAGVVPPAAHAADGPAITVGEPEGFEDLTRDRLLLVDIYFGGERRGEAQVLAAPESVTLVDPARLLELFPDLADRARVAAALEGQALAANSDLVCAPGADRARCGRLSPETVGVIFDRDRFRLDVFFNPTLLTVSDNVEDRYLPQPAGGLSFVNSIGAVLSGRSGPGRDYYNFQDQALLAWGEQRIRADLSYATELGFGADRLAFEWDRREVRFSGGALWAPGNDVGGRQKLIGLGIASQVDTRRDKDELIGSPVVVYLGQRARVDVVRDGRVLHSAIYDPGNQQLDTSSLPEGSYDIVLRIEEAGRPLREERRLYTKSRRIPSEGRTDFFAFGGLLVEGRDSGSLDPSSHPYLQGGLSHRVSRDWALDGSVEVTDRAALAELGATWLTPVAQLRAAALADTGGALGALVQVVSSGSSRFNFSLDLRRLENGDDAAVPASPPPAGAGLLDPLARGGSYSQASGIVSYSLADLRFLGAFSYRDEDDQAARYSIGPSLEWDFLRRGAFTLSFRGDVAATERGEAGFAGISLRMFNRRSSVTALAGGRSSSIADDEAGEGALAALTGTWNARAAGGDLTLGAGFEHQPLQDTALLSSEFHHPLGSLAGDFVRSDRSGEAAESQYSVGLRTTLVAGGGLVEVAGRTTTESMLVARVDGAREQDRFEVLVNEQVAGTIAGAAALTLPLPAYRAYDVRIRPVGAELLAYDSSPRTVGLYPGVVARLEWTAAPVSIKFGRLVDADGTPVAGASITGKGVWSETDADGYFQLEAADGAELTVTTRDGASFPLDLPRGQAADGIARLGAVTCCEEPVRLGALGMGQ